MLQPETKARRRKDVSEYRNFCCRGRLPRIMSKSAEDEQKEEKGSNIQEFIVNFIYWAFLIKSESLISLLIFSASIEDLIFLKKAGSFSIFNSFIYKTHVKVAENIFIVNKQEIISCYFFKTNIALK